jgi:hypothetical protein
MVYKNLTNSDSYPHVRRHVFPINQKQKGGRRDEKDKTVGCSILFIIPYQQFFVRGRA